MTGPEIRGQKSHGLVSMQQLTFSRSLWAGTEASDFPAWGYWKVCTVRTVCVCVCVCLLGTAPNHSLRGKCADQSCRECHSHWGTVTNFILKFLYLAAWTTLLSEAGAGRPGVWQLNSLQRQLTPTASDDAAVSCRCFLCSRLPP